MLEEYKVKKECMQRYLLKVKHLADEFESFKIQRISQYLNKRADALSELKSIFFAKLNKTILVEVLSEPS